MSEGPTKKQSERMMVIALALDEARRLCDEGAVPGRAFWQAIADQILAIQNAGEDFETARAYKRGLGRLLTDELRDFPPEIEKLFIVMENWRRAMKRGWE